MGVLISVIRVYIKASVDLHIINLHDDLNPIRIIILVKNR